MANIEFKNIAPRATENILKAEKNVELWGGAFDAVWKDLQEVESKEGPLDPEDPRLTAIKICGWRLDEAKRLLKNPNHDSGTEIEA